MTKTTKLRWIGGGILFVNLVIIGQYNLTGLPVLLLTLGFAIFYEWVVVRPSSNFESVELANEAPDTESTSRTANGTGIRTTSPDASRTAITGQEQPDFTDTDPNGELQTASPRTTADEEEVYAQVAKELESGLIDRGLWARLLAQADGDESQTKALYLKQRAERIFARAVKCVVPSIQAVPIEVGHVEPVVEAAVVTQFVPFAVVESSQLDLALKPVRSKSVAFAVTAIVVILGALVLSMVNYFSSKGTPERQMQATAESPSFGTAEVRRQADTPSWKVRALDMIARVERGEIPAIDGSTSRIAPADGNEWATTDTLALESNQIWWMHRTNNVASIFLYLQNQTAMDLSGATLDYQGGPCNGSAPAQTFYLTLAKPILPGGQAVVDLRPDFPIETIGESCLVIKRAWK